MDGEIIFRLAALLKGDCGAHPRDFLAQAVAALSDHLDRAVVLGYELIPELGGVPRVPPIRAGELSRPEDSARALGEAAHVGVLGSLIHRWEPCYLGEVAVSSLPGGGQAGPDGYRQFLEGEAIQSLAFLPLHGHTRLGALVLNFRSPHALSDEDWRIIEVCGALIGGQLAHMNRAVRAGSAQKRRMATAHTLYNEIALRFKQQIDTLEVELGQALGSLNVAPPPALTAHLEAAKNTVFELMRDLVIEASGDLLVNLEKMSLYKALNTAAAALERGWPATQKVAIEVQAIPPVIERQSLALRQLLYALALEAMGNAVKHGGPAPFINVELGWHDRHVYVEIIDHGQGFDVEAVPFSPHGLGFWQEYVVEQLAGSFNVSSDPGLGTVVYARIPVIPVWRVGHAE